MNKGILLGVIVSCSAIEAKTIEIKKSEPSQKNQHKVEPLKNTSNTTHITIFDSDVSIDVDDNQEQILNTLDAAQSTLDVIQTTGQTIQAYLEIGFGNLYDAYECIHHKIETIDHRIHESIFTLHEDLCHKLNVVADNISQHVDSGVSSLEYTQLHIKDCIEKNHEVISSHLNSLYEQNHRIENNQNTFGPYITERFNTIDQSLQGLHHAAYETLSNVSQGFEQVNNGLGHIKDCVNTNHQEVRLNFENLYEQNHRIENNQNTFGPYITERFNTIDQSLQGLHHAAYETHGNVSQGFEQVNNGLGHIKDCLLQEFPQLHNELTTLYEQNYRIEQHQQHHSPLVQQRFDTLDNAFINLHALGFETQNQMLHGFENLGNGLAHIKECSQTNQEELLTYLENLYEQNHRLEQQHQQFGPYVEQRFNQVDVNTQELQETANAIYAQVEQTQNNQQIFGNFFEQQVDQTHEQLETICNKFASTYVITQEDIGDGNLYAITKPGSYCLGESVVFNHGSAITISADHVILDLNSKKIEGTFNTDQAIVANNCTNLVIKNGIIANTTGLTIQNSQCFELDHLRIINGIEWGIRVSESHYGVIKNSCAYNIGFRNELGDGFIFDNGSHYIIQHSCAIHSQRNGIYTADSEFCIIKDCLVGNSVQHGIVLDGSSNSCIRQCKACYNANAGFLVTTGFTGNIFNNIESQNILFKDCTAQKNGLRNGNAGFEIKDYSVPLVGQIYHVMFEQCTSAGNSGHGFELQHAQHIGIKESIAQYNERSGIHANDINGLHLIANQAHNNQLNGIGTSPGTQGVYIVSNQLASNGNIGLENVGPNATIANNFASQNHGGNYSNVFAQPLGTPGTGYWDNIEH